MLMGLGQDATDFMASDGSDFTAIDNAGPLSSTGIDVSLAPVNVDLTATGPDLSSPLIAASAVPTVVDTGQSSSGMPTWLSNILTGVGVGAAQAGAAVVGGAINTAALQATNAQRMSVGQPPLNPNGSVMSPYQMQAAGYSNEQISRFLPQLSGTISGTMLLLIAAGVGAVLLLSSSKRG